MSTSLLLIDDNPSFVRILRQALLDRPVSEPTVVETASDPDAAAALAASLRPDAIVLELVLEGSAALDLIPRLQRAAPAASIIVLTLHDAMPYREAALAAGAHAFVSKRRLEHDLEPALRRLLTAHGVTAPQTPPDPTDEERAEGSPSHSIRPGEPR